jgi:ABC-type lipoprotein export system ATPase subunit
MQSSTEAESKLEELNKTITETLGVKNLAEARGVWRDLDSNLDEDGIKQLKTKIDELIKTINDETKILGGIEKSFPPEYDIQSGASKFEKTEDGLEKTQKERNGKDIDYKTKTSLKTQLEKDCEDLKPDYEIYPSKLNEIAEIENDEKLLNFVTDQFKIISTKQRELVLPQAEIEINQMLPLITNNRYSNFEISEDLKFTVYVKEANGFKQRDLFSGGTQDQFLIALRLAFTKSILDNRIRADEYAFFMDEPISSSDEIRKAGIFKLLGQVKQTFKQTFIIAHENISELVDHHLILGRDSDGYTKIKSQSW